MKIVQDNNLVQENAKAIDPIPDFNKVAPVPLIDSAPFFVASLRQNDRWKKKKALHAATMYEAYEEMNISSRKASASKSGDINDLLYYIKTTELDISFLMRLPSIVELLEAWWEEAVCGEEGKIECMKLRSIFSDLASTLVEGNSERVRSLCVNQVMLGSWVNWDPSIHSPLTKQGFLRVIFLLAHLFTESTRIGEYISFLRDTLGKFKQYRNTKPQRTQHYHRNIKQKDSPSKDIPTRGDVIEIELPEINDSAKVLNDTAILLPTPQNSSILGSFNDGQKIATIIAANRKSTSMKNLCFETKLSTALHDKIHQTTHKPGKEANSIARERYFPPMHITAIEYSKVKKISHVRQSPLKTTEGIDRSIHQAYSNLHILAPHIKDDYLPILRRSLSRPTILSRIKMKSSQSVYLSHCK